MQRTVSRDGNSLVRHAAYKRYNLCFFSIKSPLDDSSDCNINIVLFSLFFFIICPSCMHSDRAVQFSPVFSWLGIGATSDCGRVFVIDVGW